MEGKLAIFFFHWQPVDAKDNSKLKVAENHSPLTFTRNHGVIKKKEKEKNLEEIRHLSKM